MILVPHLTVCFFLTHSVTSLYAIYHVTHKTSKHTPVCTIGGDTLYVVNLNFDCKKKKDEINKMICIVYSYIISLVLNIQTMNLDEMISFPQLTQKKASIIGVSKWKRNYKRHSQRPEK